MEKALARTKSYVDLQSVDVEQFKALFPGGLGDAVEHWRDEARGLYTEVDQLRDQRGKDHDEIINLRSDLNITNRKLEFTKRELATTREELAAAKERIKHLEEGK
jgi:chromosome segregation ATPase